MTKYYTRACNFFYHNKNTNNNINIKKKKNFYYLNGNKRISFDTVEIISRKFSKKIKINDINSLSSILKKKVKLDLEKISKKKKFKNLNLNNLPLIMGVLNITPDSFSDGGKFLNSNKAYMHAKKIFNQGCDIIDIGAESTRPGAKEINQKVEWQRLSEPLKRISTLKKFISIDTRKEFVMKKSQKYNVGLINDVSGLSFDKNTLDFLKKSNLPFVIHHMQGTPINMQKNPRYKNILLDIYDFFEDTINKIRSAGIKHNNILLDPGIGFGKKLKHNIALIKNISIFHTLGYPLLLGVSRKKFIKEISEKNDSEYRYGGTISACLFLIKQGVQILRVHDVNEIQQAIKIFKKLIF